MTLRARSLTYILGGLLLGMNLAAKSNGNISPSGACGVSTLEDKVDRVYSLL